MVADTRCACAWTHTTIRALGRLVAIGWISSINCLHLVTLRAAPKNAAHTPSSLGATLEPSEIEA